LHAIAQERGGLLVLSGLRVQALDHLGVGSIVNGVIWIEVASHADERRALFRIKLRERHRPGAIRRHHHATAEDHDPGRSPAGFQKDATIHALIKHWLLPSHAPPPPMRRPTLFSILALSLGA